MSYATYARVACGVHHSSRIWALMPRIVFEVGHHMASCKL